MHVKWYCLTGVLSDSSYPSSSSSWPFSISAMSNCLNPTAATICNAFISPKSSYSNSFVFRLYSTSHRRLISEPGFQNSSSRLKSSANPMVAWLPCLSQFLTIYGKTPSFSRSSASGSRSGSDSSSQARSLYDDSSSSTLASSSSKSASPSESSSSESVVSDSEPSSF